VPVNLGRLVGMQVSAVRGRVIVILAVPFLIAVGGWLVGGESSPFHQYFLYHVAWPNRVAALNLPAFLIAASLSGNVHAPEDWAFWVGFLVQWLPVGLLLSLALVRKRTRRGAA
jgi:hypothetical protein